MNIRTNGKTLTNPINGQQRSEQNIAAFPSWVASKTDPDFREMVMRGQLFHLGIARECRFAKSVLLHNPRIKDALRLLEEQLRSRKVLPTRPESSLAEAPELTTSSFGWVIILLRHSKLLDRIWLYTAATRAEQQVILVSDVHIAKAAVEASRIDHYRPHFGCPSDPPGEPALNVRLRVMNLCCRKTALKSQAAKRIDKRHR